MNVYSINNQSINVVVSVYLLSLYTIRSSRSAYLYPKDVYYTSVNFINQYFQKQRFFTIYIYIYIYIDIYCKEYIYILYIYIIYIYIYKRNPVDIEERKLTYYNPSGRCRRCRVDIHRSCICGRQGCNRHSCIEIDLSHRLCYSKSKSNSMAGAVRTKKIFRIRFRDTK